MIANYHTHTYLCNHAEGQPEEYVKKAIEAGLQTLGFSDHAPFDFPNGYVSGCRMEMKDIDFYFDTLLSLREKYKNEIDIKIGFEIEYYPALWDKAIEKFRQYPLDYLILGNHFLGNESFVLKPAPAPTEDENDLIQYVSECMTALKSGRITYLCHPDMINFVGDREIYLKHMTSLINCAKSLDIPIELNMQGMRAERHYPNDVFWQLASNLGAKAVIGCDAHSPDKAADAKELEKIYRYADRFDLDILEDIELKNPLF